MPMNKEDFQRVRSLFPQSLQASGVQQAHLLKEYLEVQALQFISTHPLSAKMVFIGGTNLRILKGINRFSEDLDFDIKGMSREEFTVLTDDLLRYLNMIGWNATPKSSESDKQSAFRRSIYFPELLYQLDLSPHKEERFMMKIEAQDQGVNYTKSLARGRLSDKWRVTHYGRRICGRIGGETLRAVRSKRPSHARRSGSLVA